MTYEEAIRRLKDHFRIHDDGRPTPYLDEAVAMAYAAMEKQIPKKLIYSDFDDNGFDEIIPHRAECPACGESVEFGKWNDEESHHCECGQALSWEV